MSIFVVSMELDNVTTPSGIKNIFFLLMVLQKKNYGAFFSFASNIQYITTIILFQTAKHTCVHTLV